MSTPRTKRQFTGAQRQITTYFNPTHPSASQPQQKPVLPGAIQSDLLSVGMRIRKSVPEGYKTGTPHSAFKLWDERDDGAPLPHAARARRGGAGAGELVPFCGVHRVGGYAVQPALPADDDDDGMPGLTSSQESVESLEFEVENERKRGYVDDEDDEGAWGGGIMTVGTAGNRVIALPRGRRKGLSVGGGQENVSAEDFDDADFLDEGVFGGDHGMSDV